MSDTMRSRLRRWILEEAKNEAEIHLPELATKALAHFAKDRGFVQAFLAEMLPGVVYSEAQRALHRHRTLGDDMVTKEAFNLRTRRISSRWERWMEHVGTHHVLVMEMTRGQLFAAAALRRQQAQPHLDLAILFETLAGGMQEGDEMVRDRYTAEEIEVVRLSLGRSRGLAS